MNESVNVITFKLLVLLKRIKQGAVSPHLILSFKKQSTTGADMGAPLWCYPLLLLFLTQGKARNCDYDLSVNVTW